MRKHWKTIVGFALLGLAFAAAAYAYEAFFEYSKRALTSGFDSTVMSISMILCPSQFLFVGCPNCHAIGRDGFIMYSIIGALNAAIYAVIGVGFVTWKLL
jgi:hypothetical protein